MMIRSLLARFCEASYIISMNTLSVQMDEVYAKKTQTFLTGIFAESFIQLTSSPEHN